MAPQTIVSLQLIFSKLENYIASAIFRRIQAGIVFIDDGNSSDSCKKTNIISDIWKSGLLLAVPKHRRPIEKRLNRKFGCLKYNWKPLIPKTNLIMCRSCGHYHEAYTICGTCYEKIRLETQEIQKAMEEDQQLEPITNEATVLYEGEQALKSEEFWKGQRIIELPKKRPSWFHPNLMETTQNQRASEKQIKPDDLA